MRHLRCLCFVRPSPESIQSLIEELRDPKYGEYHICELAQRPFCMEKKANWAQTSATSSRSHPSSGSQKQTTTKSSARCRNTSPTSSS